MESANIHHQHHHLQDQLVIGSSSSSSSSLTTTTTSPSNYGAESAYVWTPNITLNSVGSGNFYPYCNGGAEVNPRQKNESTSMIQDWDFHFHCNTNNNNAAAESFNNHCSQQYQHLHHLPKIKDDLISSSDSYSFPKFTEMLNTAPSIEHQDSHHGLSSPSSNNIKAHKDHLNDILSEKLLLKTISSGFPITGTQFSPGEIYSNIAPNSCSTFRSCNNNNNNNNNNVPSRSGTFISQIYPSINISNLNQTSSSSSGSFDMNLQALDLLSSKNFCGSNFCQPPRENLGLFKDSLSFGLDRLQQSSAQRPSCSPKKVSSQTNERDADHQAKRPNNNFMEPKPVQGATASKKSRTESHSSSCPPFKVRKEKLGDRIAALQQLVAPFGKTDTASVLMEAIGYIKFLQNQVQTLSVPYMKSSRNKSSRSAMQGVSNAAADGNEEGKRDLRSRGLCLVPLSCMSYVTADAAGGGGIWPSPNYGGGT